MCQDLQPPDETWTRSYYQNKKSQKTMFEKLTSTFSSAKSLTTIFSKKPKSSIDVPSSSTSVTSTSDSKSAQKKEEKSKPAPPCYLCSNNTYQIQKIKDNLDDLKLNYDKYDHEYEYINRYKPSLHRLPLEIQWDILRPFLVLNRPIEIYWNSHLESFTTQSYKSSAGTNLPSVSDALGMFTANKRLSDAALDIFYGENSFRLSVDGYGRQWLFDIGPENRKRLKRVSIYFHSEVITKQVELEVLRLLNDIYLLEKFIEPIFVDHPPGPLLDLVIESHRLLRVGLWIRKYEIIPWAPVEEKTFPDGSSKPEEEAPKALPEAETQPTPESQTSPEDADTKMTEGETSDSSTEEGTEEVKKETKEEPKETHAKDGSPTTPPDPSKASLMTLPRDVRERIWKYIVPEGEMALTRSQMDGLPEILPYREIGYFLIFLNKQIYEEVRELLYGTLTFKFASTPTHKDLAYSFFDYVNPEDLLRIRNIDLQFSAAKEYKRNNGQIRRLRGVFRQLKESKKLETLTLRISRSSVPYLSEMALLLRELQKICKVFVLVEKLQQSHDCFPTEDITWMIYEGIPGIWDYRSNKWVEFTTDVLDVNPVELTDASKRVIFKSRNGL